MSLVFVHCHLAPADTRYDIKLTNKHGRVCLHKIKYLGQVKCSLGPLKTFIFLLCHKNNHHSTITVTQDSDTVAVYTVKLSFPLPPFLVELIV